MKYLKVITSSPGLSGAGLISDFLLSRKDFISPFKNNPDEDQQSEFRFVSDPGGLISLYKGFYENFSINNCAYIYDEFNKYLDKIKKLKIINNNKIIFLYNKDFFKEVEIFKSKIVKLSYYGLPQFYRIGMSQKEKFMWKVSSRYKTAQDTKFLKMIIPVKKEKFIHEAKSFINKALFAMAKKKNRNFIIDQGANFWNPEMTSIFFSNCRIILVIRDPRSIFASMKNRKSLSYPGHDVDVFIKWYKLIMKDLNKIKKSKKTIIIKYEKFIVNKEIEIKRLLKFLNLKSLKNKDFDVNKSRQNIFKAKKTLTKIEINKIERNLKKYLQWPKKKFI